MVGPGAGPVGAAGPVDATLGALAPGGLLCVVPSLGPGGSQRQAAITVLGLHDRALGVAVLAADLSSSPARAFFRDRLVDAGIPVRELPGPAALPPSRAGVRSPDDASGDWAGLVEILPERLRRAVPRYHAAFRVARPRVVHAWTDLVSVPAGIAAVLAGVPRIVLAGRGVSPRRTLPAAERRLLPAYRRLAAQPGVTLVNNSAAGAADCAAWLDVPTGRIAVVYNGLDLRPSRPPTPTAVAAFRALHGLAGSDFVVGALLRFAADKRPLLWLEAAARLLGRVSCARFLLFGTGRLQGAMEAFVQERGLVDRVRLAGPVEDSTLALSSFDVALLTSSFEGTPNVLLEAQALGIPVVATGEGGVAEALRHGVTGLHLPGATASDLADALVALAGDGARRRRMGAAGRAFVAARFGRDRMIEQTLRLYGMRSAAGGGACRA